MGVTASEFIIEESDTDDAAAEIINEMLNAEQQYNVVKLPVSKPGLTRALQQNGYSFMECMLSVTHSLNPSVIAAGEAVVKPGVTCLPMNGEDFELLRGEIKKGLFDTDRIFNDARFPKEASARRYINWINDERGRGASIYKLTAGINNGNEAIGFFCLKQLNGDIYDTFLLGLYSGYKKQGYGKNLIHGALREIKRAGGRALSTHVSSNNPASVKIFKALGCEISEAVYVFVKHLVHHTLL